VTESNLLPLYVATPKLLRRYEMDAGETQNVDILTVRPTLEGFQFLSVARLRGLKPKVRSVDLPAYSSLPTTLILPATLARYGWRSIPAGWLIESRQPLTTERLNLARNMAADAGVTIETRDRQQTLSRLRAGATATGTLIALIVLVMTVGLIRSEAAGDLRVLSATGATSGTRRTLTRPPPVGWRS
jgi:putative ABC transport system permease protein